MKSVFKTILFVLTLVAAANLTSAALGPLLVPIIKWSVMHCKDDAIMAAMTFIPFSVCILTWCFFFIVFGIIIENQLDALLK